MQVLPIHSIRKYQLSRTAGRVEAGKEGKIVYYNIGADYIHAFLKAGRHFYEETVSA
jgi:hypothetical protein